MVGIHTVHAVNIQIIVGSRIKAGGLIDIEIRAECQLRRCHKWHQIAHFIFPIGRTFYAGTVRGKRRQHVLQHMVGLFQNIGALRGIYIKKRDRSKTHTAVTNRVAVGIRSKESTQTITLTVHIFVVTEQGIVIKRFFQEGSFFFRPVIIQPVVSNCEAHSEIRGSQETVLMTPVIKVSGKLQICPQEILILDILSQQISHREVHTSVANGSAATFCNRGLFKHSICRSDHIVRPCLHRRIGLRVRKDLVQLILIDDQTGVLPLFNAKLVLQILCQRTGVKHVVLQGIHLLVSQIQCRVANDHQTVIIIRFKGLAGVSCQQSFHFALGCLPLLTVLIYGKDIGVDHSRTGFIDDCPSLGAVVQRRRLRTDQIRQPLLSLRIRRRCIGAIRRSQTVVDRKIVDRVVRSGSHTNIHLKQITEIRDLLTSGTVSNLSIVLNTCTIKPDRICIIHRVDGNCHMDCFVIQQFRLCCVMLW